MESFIEIWDYISLHVLPHYPFLVGYFSFVLVGQFAKHQVWTKKRAFTPGKHQKFFHFMRRTLAMHAPVTGLVLGAIPGIPASPGVLWAGGTMLYWAGCGVAASFSFHAFSDALKKRTGVDFERSIEDAVDPDHTDDLPA